MFLLNILPAKTNTSGLPEMKSLVNTPYNITIKRVINLSD